LTIEGCLKFPGFPFLCLLNIGLLNVMVVSSVTSLFLWVAVAGGRAVACCSMKTLDARIGEMQQMYWPSSPLLIRVYSAQQSREAVREESPPRLQRPAHPVA